MNQKTYFSATSALFLIISLLHLWRALSGELAYVAGWVVPMWVSWAVFVVVGYLAYWGFKLSR